MCKRYADCGLPTCEMCSKMIAPESKLRPALCRRLSAFWEGVAWPLLRPLCSASLHAGQACTSLAGRALRQTGESLLDLLWRQTAKPLLQACRAELARAWQAHVVPVLLAASNRVKGCFEFMGRELLLPLVQLLGASLTAVVNGVAWAVVRAVSYLYEYVLFPVALWVYHRAVAPFATSLLVFAGACSAFVVALHKLGFKIFYRPQRYPRYYT